MRLVVVALGRLKTPGLRDAAEHFKKGIQTWTSVEEVELKPIEVPDKSEATRARIQEKEMELVLGALRSRLSSRGELFLLDEGGKSEPTLRWADRIRDWENRSIQEVAFCIGGSLGFSDELRAKARGRLSLGPQTLSHELARVVLFEQLYRALSVTRGHPYHNEG